MAGTGSDREVDYLDEDKPIRGQNFVCLSFISPEDVLARKDVFMFDRYLAQFSAEFSQVFENLKAKYPDDAEMIDGIAKFNAHMFSRGDLQENFRQFMSLHNEALEKAFREENPFKTTVRGIKVRGAYDTLEEAKVRCQVLKKMGDKFDIYVAQVGCWCPWSPNPEDMQDMEYAESQLNTLVKGYKQNLDSRDAVFSDRKQEALDRARRKLAQRRTAQAPAQEAAPSTSGEPSRVMEELYLEDPWRPGTVEQKEVAQN